MLFKKIIVVLNVKIQESTQVLPRSVRGNQMRGNTGGQLEMIKQIQTNRKMENGSTKKFTFVGITSSKDVTGLRKSNE